jgi:DNA mismatch repair protein MutS2
MDAHSLDCLDFARIRELLSSYALSGLGKSLTSAIHPVSRLTLVQRWLAQVEEMQRLVEERGMPPFGGISDVREMLLRCAPPLRVTVEDLAQIGATLAGTHAVGEYLRNLPENSPELHHLAERVGDFRTIADRIARVIDERARVRDDASPKLAQLRREIEDAGRQIQQTVERLLREPGLRRLLQYPNHTFHGDRVVFPLRTEYRGRLPGIVHRTSDSGATLYVEPAEVVELNNQISNLRSAEQEEINRLLWELAHEVHLNGREIHKTLDTLAVVDLIVAKVRFARDFGLCCPRILEAGVLNVREARHPLLLDLARRKGNAGQPADEIVPVDYRLGQDFVLLIVTGPNTGGKTVTLKTIGLLSLMVQAGLPAPVAPGAEFGVFTNILIDVGDEQNMQQSLSTFSGHMTRLLDMLRHAGPRTLLLIDELGAGTDPDEGAALGRALLDELLRLECRCVATTHLGALKGFALTRQGAENACVEFDAQTLRPTYHLRLGEPGSSNAIDVAQRLGMPRRLVGAARRNLSRKARALQAALEGTRTVKRQAEDARRAAEDARVEAQRAQTEAQAAQARYERQHADFHEWVRRVVHLQPGDPVRVRNFDRDGRIVRMRLEQHRAEVDVGAFSVEVPLGDVLPPQTPAPPPRPPLPVVRPVPVAAVVDIRKAAPPRKPPSAAPPVPKPAERQESRSRPVLPPLTVEQAAALRPLDMVYVQRFHRDGRVVRLNSARKLAVVNVGLLEVEVPFDGLAIPPQPEPARPIGRPEPAKAAEPQAAPSANQTVAAGAPSPVPLSTAPVPEAPAQPAPVELPPPAEGAAPATAGLA